MSDSRPIGVFDSGIGGLTVVKALRDLLPDENIFYLGDTARVPYGPKSPETVQRYAVELAGMLMGKNAKALVVACNTVSSVALPLLTKKFSVPVIGVIEPGARAALQATRNRHIGVIGTRATIRSGAYEKALRAVDEQCAREQSRLSVARPVNRRRTAQRRCDGPNDHALSRTHACRWDRHTGPWLHALSAAHQRDCASGQTPNHARRFGAKLRACGGRNTRSTITSDGVAKSRRATRGSHGRSR